VTCSLCLHEDQRPLLTLSMHSGFGRLKSAASTSDYYVGINASSPNLKRDLQALIYQTKRKLTYDAAWTAFRDTGRYLPGVSSAMSHRRVAAQGTCMAAGNLAIYIPSSPPPHQGTHAMRRIRHGSQTSTAARAGCPLRISAGTTRRRATATTASISGPNRGLEEPRLWVVALTQIFLSSIPVMVM